MFAIIPAYPTTQRAHLAASPVFADIAAAHAAIVPGTFAVRVPVRKTARHADIVVFHDADVALASAIGGRVTVEGGTATACRHNNVGVPLIARTDEHSHECFSCGAGITAAI